MSGQSWGAFARERVRPGPFVRAVTTIVLVVSTILILAVFGTLFVGFKEPTTAQIVSLILLLVGYACAELMRRTQAPDGRHLPRVVAPFVWLLAIVLTVIGGTTAAVAFGLV